MMNIKMIVMMMADIKEAQHWMFELLQVLAPINAPLGNITDYFDQVCKQIVTKKEKQGWGIFVHTCPKRTVQCAPRKALH